MRRAGGAIVPPHGGEGLCLFALFLETESWRPLCVLRLRDGERETAGMVPCSNSCLALFLGEASCMHHSHLTRSPSGTRMVDVTRRKRMHNLKRNRAQGDTKQITIKPTPKEIGGK